jgi:hypothetical protein
LKNRRKAPNLRGFFFCLHDVGNKLFIAVALCDNRAPPNAVRVAKGAFKVKEL